MCISSFSTTFVWNIFHSKENWVRYVHKGIFVLTQSTQVFLSDFNENWIFWTEFRKIFKYKISWKSLQWERSCSMRTYGRTDTARLIVAFRNFANSPNTAVVIKRTVCNMSGEMQQSETNSDRIRLWKVPI